MTMTSLKTMKKREILLAKETDSWACSRIRASAIIMQDSALLFPTLCASASTSLESTRLNGMKSCPTQSTKRMRSPRSSGRKTSLSISKLPKDRLIKTKNY